jgi:hypothetical protein
MDIIIGPRGQAKKFNMPHCCKDESNDDNAPGKSWCGKQLTDRQQVHDSRKRQRDHEVRSAPIAEVA